jgi:hypothetical protein
MDLIHKRQIMCERISLAIVYARADLAVVSVAVTRATKFCHRIRSKRRH